MDLNLIQTKREANLKIKFDKENLLRFKSQVKALKEKSEIPTVIYGFCNGEQEVTEILSNEGYGTDVLFPTASLSKSLAAILTLKLYDENKIDLYEKVITYLPEFKVADENLTKTIRVLDLLTHRTGFEDNFAVLFRGQDAKSKFLEHISTSRRLCNSGEEFSFCNTGYILLGFLIENIVGKPYKDFAKEMLIDPIGMNSAFYYNIEKVNKCNTMKGYESISPVIKSEHFERLEIWHPMNTFYASVGDILKYGRFIASNKLKNGSHFLKTETFKGLVCHGSVQVRNHIVHEISPWFDINHWGGVTHLLRKGFTENMYNVLWVVPELDFCFFIVGNYGSTEHQFVIPAGHAMMREILDIEYGYPATIQPSKCQLDDCVGIYESFEEKLEIKSDNKNLLLLPLKLGKLNKRYEKLMFEHPLESYDTDRYLIKSETPVRFHPIDFIRDSDNKVEFVRFNESLCRKLS